MYYSPKTSTDGLVFHYDTGNTVRSYLGEPTTNLNPYTLSDSGTDGSGQSNVGTRTILSSNHVRIVDVDSNTRQTHLIGGLTGGTIYTISVEFKKLSGTPTFRFQIQDHSGGTYLRTIKFTDTAEIGIADIDGWQTASWTFTLGADANAVRIWYQDGADYTTYTHSFELRNPQLEAKSHPTPYTPPSTTRSATQGLKDLTGGSTIDISPTSFNSNAEIEYDGTNDYIYVGSKTWSFPSGATVEQVIKPLTLNREQGFFTLNNYGAGSYINFWMPTSNTMRWEVIGTTSSGYSTINGTTVFQTGRYYHVVGTFNGTTTKIYINGIEENSQTMANQPTSMTAQMDIGRYDTSYPSSAQIPVTKFYTRPLTAAEIQRNFNAVKSRFNIA